MSRLDRRDALLLAAVIVLNAGGFVLGVLLADSAATAPRAYLPKPAGLLSIVLLAVMAWRHARRDAAARRLAIGILFCFGGDCTLAVGLVPVALALFLIGYALYCTAFLADGRPKPTGAVWLVLGVLGWYVTAYQGTAQGPLLWAALVYSLVLAGLAATARSMPLKVAGAVLLLSDVLIAARMFRRPLYADLVPEILRGDIVWLTYALGQSIIHCQNASRAAPARANLPIGGTT